MNDFEREVLARLPLAEAVCVLLRHTVSPEFAASLFDRHRGTGCEAAIRFGTLVELVTDALVQHGGSGRQSFERARADGRLEATTRAVYGKLGRVPQRLSQAFLAEATQRLSEVLPTGCSATLPASLREMDVVVVDGKKIKNLAKRLKPLRGVAGKMLAGKGLVALSLNTQLAVAMETSLDGEANDAPLTPGLLAQVRELLPRPLLYVADSQFCDLTIPRKVLDQASHFLIRFSNKMRFFPEKSQTGRDRQGRTVHQEWGWLGAPREGERRLYVRRITLQRSGEEDVSLVSDLLDDELYPAEDLLDVYLQRWTIERVFQQVTEVFHLQQLIGSTPQGALFQFSLCLLLYNFIQVIRQYVGMLSQRTPSTISSELLFRDIRDQLTVVTKLLDRREMIQQLDCSHPPAAVRQRLQELLHDQWTPAWLKAPAKKKAAHPPNPQQPVPGGHSSAWKLLRTARDPPAPVPPAS
ncbi:MAG TPA: transposase [Pirellulales bacterium]|jgi:hypothetical protein|nr:transposase [Pirellulales bacterium]